MPFVGIAQQFVTPDVDYTRYTIDGTPTYAVWTMGRGVFRKLVWLCAIWGFIKWFVKAQGVLMPASANGRVQIDATPTYAVETSTFGRFFPELNVIPYLLSTEREYPILRLSTGVGL